MRTLCNFVLAKLIALAGRYALSPTLEMSCRYVCYESRAPAMGELIHLPPRSTDCTVNSISLLSLQCVLPMHAWGPARYALRSGRHRLPAPHFAVLLCQSRLAGIVYLDPNHDPPIGIWVHF